MDLEQVSFEKIDNTAVFNSWVQSLTHHDVNLHYLSGLIDRIVVRHRSAHGRPNERMERMRLRTLYKLAAEKYNELCGWKCFHLNMPR